MVLLKDKAPVRSGESGGALKRSLMNAVRNYHRKTIAFGITGVDYHHIEYDKRGQKIRPAKYLHLVELGTTKNPGGIAGLHFVSASQNQVNAEVLDIFIEEINKALQ
jgi:hypothetical protein